MTTLDSLAESVAEGDKLLREHQIVLAGLPEKDGLLEIPVRDTPNLADRNPGSWLVAR
jgi:hypothetical protein